MSLLLALVLAACRGGPAAVVVAGDADAAGTVGARLDQGLNRSLERLAARGFSGASMVMVAGEPVLLEGHGFADRIRGLEAGPDTLFQLGSVTKQFTAAAILKLQMQGRLHVHDPLDRYLPDVPSGKRAITIHHLLTHTAGLRDRAVPCSSDIAGLSRDGYVARVLGAPLRSRPGAKHHYSNDGYALLGAIVEQASGETYEGYLRCHLLAPAGMQRTGHTFDEAVAEDAARGYGDGLVYMGNLDPRLRNQSGPAWCNRASGGLLSTARDMQRWMQALRGTAVLSEAARRALIAPHVREAPRARSFHGYGWRLLRTPRKTPVAVHDGSLSGYYTAELRWYLDEDMAVFVAANDAQMPAPLAVEAIERVLFGER